MPSATSSLSTSLSPVSPRRGVFTPNRSRVEHGVGIVELTNRQGETIAEARVSVEDLPRVLAHGRWCVKRDSNTSYAKHGFCENGVKNTLFLHRFILEPVPVELWVDHVDGNGLNNCRENLRLVTPAENQQNLRKGRASSGVKNVYYDRYRNMWRVTLYTNGAKSYHGHFATIEEAAAIAEAARRALHTHSPENSSPPRSPDSSAQKGVTAT